MVLVYRCSLLLFLFQLVIVFVVSSQEPIIIGEEMEIYSSTLGENRTIQVHLPIHYDDSTYAPASNPVMYVLDGESNFSFISTLERFNTKFLYRSQPEMIIVGIKNTDRTRDLTPTRDTTNAVFSHSGGGSSFLKFIEKELKPYVDSSYRTNGYDILWGHSFSGLFTLYTMQEKPWLFDSYVAIDPSVWWDKGIINTRFESLSDNNNYRNNQLYLAISGVEDDSKQKRFQRDMIDHFETTILPNLKELRYEIQLYPQYNHGDVPLTGTIDGIKFLFDGIELPVKKIAQNPQLIWETYKTFSDRIKFDFQPDESLIHMLINLCNKQKSSECKEQLYHYGIELYPDSQKFNTLHSDEW